MMHPLVAVEVVAASEAEADFMVAGCEPAGFTAVECGVALSIPDASTAGAAIEWPEDHGPRIR
jgi:hypothetical protein